MSRTKKSKGRAVLVIILAAVIIAALFFLGKAKKEADSDRFFAMSGNAQRVEFLNRQGYIVKPDPVKREDVTVPSEFNETYMKYVEMQKVQGLDLEDHKGDKAILFSYEVLNYPEIAEGVFAELLVADDKLIACQLRCDDEEHKFLKSLITKGLQDFSENSEPDEKRSSGETSAVTEADVTSVPAEAEDLSETSVAAMNEAADGTEVTAETDVDLDIVFVPEESEE